MTIVIWAALLILQNAAFTWVSRARNSASYGYHALASVFSNGIFFGTNLFLIKLVTLQGLSVNQLVILGAVYVSATVTGSVLMHIVSRTLLEKGKRRVGA